MSGLLLKKISAAVPKLRTTLSGIIKNLDSKTKLSFDWLWLNEMDL